MALLYQNNTENIQSHLIGSPKTVSSKVRHLSRNGAKPDFRPTTTIIVIASETNNKSLYQKITVADPPPRPLFLNIL